MVTLDNAITARLKRGDKHFEVMVDPDLALSLRKGEDVDIAAMLAVASTCAEPVWDVRYQTSAN